MPSYSFGMSLLLLLRRLQGRLLPPSSGTKECLECIRQASTVGGTVLGLQRILLLLLLALPQLGVLQEGSESLRHAATDAGLR